MGDGEIINSFTIDDLNRIIVSQGVITKDLLV